MTAFDGSAEMVRLARQHTGLPVLHMTFDEMSWEAAFDGIWASASLLHVPRAELPEVAGRLARALRPAGLCYISMKLGDGEQTMGDRTFTDITPEALAQIVQGAGLSVLEVYETMDVRPHRQDRWVNALMGQMGAATAN